MYRVLLEEMNVSSSTAKGRGPYGRFQIGIFLISGGGIMRLINGFKSG